MKRDEWIQVRDASELRAGMCVELRPCPWCERPERKILIAEAGLGPCVMTDGTVEHGYGFVVSNDCDGAPEADFSAAIDMGILYRLADAEPEAAETREKEEVGS